MGVLKRSQSHLYKPIYPPHKEIRTCIQAFQFFEISNSAIDTIFNETTAFERSSIYTLKKILKKWQALTLCGAHSARTTKTG
jgi:hypothetical protein